MGKKVLVIDDESSICDLINLALTGKGYEVKSAVMGTEGVKLADEFGPDMILLDLTMPDISGVEAARMIREKDTIKNIPIIVMSGRSTSESDLDRSLFTGILNKPFSIADLVRTAERFTQK